MREYGELRKTPEMSHRIQAATDTPLFYQLAQSILAQEGKTTNNVRRVENEEYCLAQKGKTISILKKSGERKKGWEEEKNVSDYDTITKYKL